MEIKLTEEEKLYLDGGVCRFVVKAESDLEHAGEKMTVIYEAVEKIKSTSYSQGRKDMAEEAIKIAATHRNKWDDLLHREPEIIPTIRDARMEEAQDILDELKEKQNDNL